MKKIVLVIILTGVLVACNNKNHVVIKGQFFGSAGKNIILEELSPTSATIVDSIRSGADGKFKFKIDLTNVENPTFYNVRLDNQFVPLLVEGGEKIELSAIGNINNNYTVNGSRGSELLSEFNRQTLSYILKLDSITRLYENAPTFERSQELSQDYRKQYIKMKQSTINFVVTNRLSLVSIVPLYQATFNDVSLFDHPDDIVYYRSVADSLGKYYPTSPYVIALRRDIGRVDNVMAMDSLLNAGMNSAGIGYPDIAIKDAAGKEQRLSSIQEKLVLLSFTSSSEPNLKVLNRELVSIYTKYHPLGLEIYEVSIDNDKAQWLTSITQNRLPWIQVCDFLGTNSPHKSMYNVRTLPSYFLINPKGEILKAHIAHDLIESEIAKLLK